MKILGLSFGYHDSAAALLIDGKIIAADQEERYSRVKHDRSFPNQAIEYCLSAGNCSPKDLDAVIYYEDSLLKFDRIVRMTRPFSKIGYDNLTKITQNWIAQFKFQPKNEISESLGIPLEKVHSVRHHDAHAAAAFYSSPFSESAILTIDGVGEKETCTLMTAKNGRLKKFHAVNYPHSIGLVYSAFTSFLGFEVNDAEYKVMGMAAFGQPSFLKEVLSIVKIQKNGKFLIKKELINSSDPNQPLYTQHFINKFGNPRKSESSFSVSKKDASEDEITTNIHFANLAASIQKATEIWVSELAKIAVDITGYNNLCIAGGVALNSLANAKIQKMPDLNLFIQPSPGDAGCALGAAQFYYYCILGFKKNNTVFTPFLGKSFSTADIRNRLDEKGFSVSNQFSRKELLRYVASELHNGKVIAWFQGNAEWGPRALGSRSILANPTLDSTQEMVNKKVKFREPFRPFAPSVLEKHASDYFCVNNNIPNYSPENYMLSIVNVLEHQKNKIPAVTHIDGTARIQLVRRSLNPLYHDLISEFQALSGVPILLNTSLNLRGQPIAGDPWDAMEIFSYSDIDILAIGSFIINKRDLEWQ